MQLFSTGVYCFKLTPEQFWELTPAQFFALQKQHENEVEFRDYGFGIIASTIANANRDSKKKKTPFKWYDFMPQYKDKYKKAEKQSPEQMRHIMENIIAPHFNALAELEKKAE